MLDLIEDASRTAARVHFVPQGTTVTVAELWAASHQAAASLQDTIGPETPVAMILDTSPEALAMFLGACRGGRRIVSLPGPPRGSSLGAYRSFIERSCALSGAEHLLTGGSYVRLFAEFALTVNSFEAADPLTPGGRSSTRPLEESAERTELVQFTSGSTADPKGVRLPLERVTANVTATLDALDLQPGDASCSWLPLSHDMGLIGMALSSLCGTGPRWACGGDVVLIKPEWFLRRPESWLEACASFGATITASPDFGFMQAVRRGHTAGITDLSRLRVCITGAEPVRAATLRAFTDAFAPAGFDGTAFCPAYGLAEAGLAVTMTPPSRHWQSIMVEGDQVGEGAQVPPAGVELVSAGPPLPGYAVEIADGPEPARRLRISGPSLFDGYLTRGAAQDGPQPAHEGATWFETNDAAFVHDGELYVAGRIDDVVVLAGRNLYLTDIEAAACATGAAPRDRVQAIPSGDGFSVVAERVGPDYDVTAQALRRAVVAAVGLSPSEVLIVKRGGLPRTPSGKPRRAALVKKLDDADGLVLHRSVFRS